MKRSKPEKPASSTVTPELQKAHAATWELGPDPFGQLGLSETEREKLASIGRLASLATEPKAPAFFIRLGTDSVTPKEVEADCQIGLNCSGKSKSPAELTT